jgi:HAD superfamily hydrolase (TIGR01549 family)
LITNIKAVVFDLDNTLVSSTLDFKAIRAELNCPENKDLLDFIDELNEEEQALASDIVLQHELRDAHTSFALNGCHQLLENLVKQDFHIAIVTRNCRQAANIKLQNNKLNIPILLTREDHPAKPKPDALLHLAELWQISSTEMLYVGDYLYDIQTARNANAMSCLLSYGEKLSYAHEADLLVDDLAHLNSLFHL